MIDIRLPASGFRRFLFGMLSGLPVFTGVYVTYNSYQGSSLTLRMTAAEEGERIIRHAFLAAGIYRASITYDAYQDSSLALRMTAAGNGAKDTKPEA